MSTLSRTKIASQQHAMQTAYNKQTSTSYKILYNQLFQQVCKQGYMTSRSALFRNLSLNLSGAHKCWRYDKFRLMIGEETNEIQEN